MTKPGKNKHAQALARLPRSKPRLTQADRIARAERLARVRWRGGRKANAAGQTPAARTKGKD